MEGGETDPGFSLRYISSTSLLTVSNSYQMCIPFVLQLVVRQLIVVMKSVQRKTFKVSALS